MNHIQKISKRFRIIFIFGFWIIPIFNFAFWLSGGFPNVPTVDVFMPTNYVLLVQTMSLGTRAIGCLITFIPASIVMLVLYLLIKLFKLYEQNKIFTKANVKTIRNIGYTVLIGEMISLIYHPIITVFVSGASNITRPIAEIKFDIGDVTTFLVAFVIILIAWVMRAGQKLQEESDYTV
jgi:hypothetical protein